MGGISVGYIWFISPSRPEPKHKSKKWLEEEEKEGWGEEWGSLLFPLEAGRATVPPTASCVQILERTLERVLGFSEALPWKEAGREVWGWSVHLAKC